MDDKTPTEPIKPVDPPKEQPAKVIPERIYIVDELQRIKNNVPDGVINKRSSNEGNKQG